jgi:hypothetical protein
METDHAMGEFRWLTAWGVIQPFCMKSPRTYRLSETEKDALLLEQGALIEDLSARVTELEA